MEDCAREILKTVNCTSSTIEHELFDCGLASDLPSVTIQSYIKLFSCENVKRYSMLDLPFFAGLVVNCFCCSYYIFESWKLYLKK